MMNSPWANNESVKNITKIFGHHFTLADVPPFKPDLPAVPQSEEQIRQRMIEVGIDTPGKIVMDGEFHRFPIKGHIIIKAINMARIFFITMDPFLQVASHGLMVNHKGEQNTTKATGLPKNIVRKIASISSNNPTYKIMKTLETYFESK